MDLIPVNFKETRVLTTEQLAQVYECETRNISENFKNNEEKFIEGKHYFKLQGDILKSFKLQSENFGLQISAMTRIFYLWTRQGASRHCKMLGTDKAWEQFDVLEENYFNPQQNLLTNNLSPQLQLLINMELKQKEIEIRQDKQAQEIQGIREVVALNPNDWRKDTNGLVNKMALSIGGYENAKPIRNESYKLLDERMGVDLACRLTNKRRRMAEEGVCKSKRDKLNQLDVIADDKKLIEGYLAIIKEMAIKYGVSCA